MREAFQQIHSLLLRAGGGLQILPLELLWLLLLVGAAGAVFLVLKLANWRLRRSFEAMARITDVEIRLEPQGIEIGALYQFRFRGRPYRGSGTVPLHAFLPPDAWIGSHPVLDVPVLHVDGSVLVGEEAIEHLILSLRASVPVRFLSADPTRNAPMVEAHLSGQR